MPRNGTNPNKTQPAEKEFGKLVLTCVTHLPNLEDYHAERLEVVQACLRSMRAGAHAGHTMIVWDNGSCADLRDWLQFDFKPDALVLSVNVGKTAARTALIRMCHPKAIVGYADDDMLFYDNWLAPQMELLQHFPNVASVTGYPVRTSFRWGCGNTIAWARKHGELEIGRFLPQEWEDDFAVSIGRDVDWHKDYTREDLDYRVTYKGRQAYCTSHHCQFIGRAEIIGRVLQYDGLAMGDEKVFDRALDSIGLRLATTQRLSRHIGNVMDEKLKSEILMLA